MRLNRFIVDQLTLKSGTFHLRGGEILNQLRSVLKMRVEERIILCDGNNSEAITEIKGYGKEGVDLEIGEVVQNGNEPEKHIVLYCAVLKKENFELVVQKATEAGVKEIVPVITERTVKLNIRQDRLNKIIREAAEQSGRGTVPKLHEPVEFKDAIGNSGQGDNFLFDGSGESFNAPERHKGQINIWIGPEGGWSEAELELARSSDFRVFTLGKLTLRAETAAIVATYLAIHKI